MGERPEDPPAVWGQLGASAVPERRKEEIRQQARQSDLVSVFFLAPGGLFLILAGTAWMWFLNPASRLAIATILLGFAALGGAVKIVLGRR